MIVPSFKWDLKNTVLGKSIPKIMSHWVSS